MDCRPTATGRRRRLQRALLCAAASVLAVQASCAAPQPSPKGKPDTAASGCPTRANAKGRLPGTEPQHLRLSYWLDRFSADELDRPLLSAAQIADYNRRVGRRPGDEPTAQQDLLAPWPEAERETSIAERIAFMVKQAKSGTYVQPDGTPLPPDAIAAMEAEPEPDPQTPLLVALSPTQLRCGAYPRRLRKAEAGSGSFDRNACSTAHSQEVLQQLAVSPNGMRLVRTRFSLGWIDADANVVTLPKTHAEAFVRGPRAVTPVDTTLGSPAGVQRTVPAHTTLPQRDDGRLLLATASGVENYAAPEAFVPTRRPLTRRALLETAFSFLDSPYGFGGENGGRDCSRLTLDVFEAFDLALPRFSGWQAKAGTRAVDVPADASEAERLRLIDQVHAKGVALLYLPGHIMLYLGRDASGTPMVLHALGEYARPCEGEGETVVDVRRTTVSTLELGRGSSRTSLLERITRIVQIGGAAAPAARPALPTAEDCGDDVDLRIFASPDSPLPGDELRVIATAEHELQGARLWLWDPDGKPVDIEVRALGGPPYTRWTAVPDAQPGRYTAVVGDGDRILACKRIGVFRPKAEADHSDSDAPVWAPRWKWERDTENLWSAFVEQLFDYPVDDGRTWTNLHSLLRDRSRNLLYNHKGLGEDEKLEMHPDCADLPYSLRAYFAWKLNLPFGFRRCSRGRPHTPPRCGNLNTNLTPRKPSGDLDAFNYFANRQVRSGVHSASGRTHPKDNDSDFYPVPLTRDALRPGTVYADPHGHVLMLSKWYEQGPPDSGEYGVLMASEAQPDGTVGRRRFWEGSFLFDPSTEHVGAGFKHFRPLVFDRAEGEIRALPNEALKDAEDFPPFSMEQYGIDKAAFYDRMDALINPRPLDPTRRMTALVDALEESVARRVTAVDNGEEHVRQHGVIEMPSGYAIFETQGPWEDFSTPARDMRLLVSLDTVLGFPERVARQPERFQVDGKPADPDRLRAHLRAELAAREFRYIKSNGDPHTLTLADLADRRQAMEMAYNPNDCMEIRWGAPRGSKEFASCKRRAPAEQRDRMVEYRPWFEARARPPRGTP